MASFPFPETLDEAKVLDREDPLGSLRGQFKMPSGTIYLVGHSLGAASAPALRRARATLDKEWPDGIVRSWNDADWIDLPQKVAASLARIIGADPDEVMVCDNVSTNLFKLAAAAGQLPLKSKLLIVEENEFPTDQYIIEGLGNLSGAKFLRTKTDDGINQLKKKGGILVRSVVSYRSSAVTDIAAYEDVARAAGGAIVWDLSHATGVVELDLKSAGAKFAAGCTYKYLNGGPGAPAFLYVRNDVVRDVISPLPGWMGCANPFEFTPTYEPKMGAARFASGTPPILSLSALAGALEVFDGLETELIAAKTRRMGDLCLAWAERLGLPTDSPAIGEMRGGHVSLLHKDGYPIAQALAAVGVITDFRAPNAIRFGFSPLYNSFEDVWRAMAALQNILQNRSWDTPAYKKRAKVT